MRKAFLERNTQETRIRMDLNLDGSGQWDLNTGIPFFDHMLSHIIKHSRMDCRLQLEGDLGIDCHHSVEDTAIVMGQLIHQALGDKAGLERYGHSVLPMDETLTTVAVDMGGRFAFHYQGSSTIKEGKFGIYDAELSLEFLQKLAMNARMNLHVVVHYGDNRHHIHESVFKALGRSFRMAFQRNGSDIPSTKGLLE